MRGIDVDASVLDQARAAAPHLDWILGDLADVPDAAAGTLLDAVVMAGLVVAGSATDRDVSPADWKRWCAAAGLELVRARDAWGSDAPAPTASGLEPWILGSESPERLGMTLTPRSLQVMGSGGG